MEDLQETCGYLVNLINNVQEVEKEKKINFGFLIDTYQLLIVN